MTAGALAPSPAIVVWALLSNRPHPGAAFTLHRFTADGESELTLELACRDQARDHVPAGALHVRRAKGDEPALVDAWVEVPPAVRELLLTDPEFLASPAG